MFILRILFAWLLIAAVPMQGLAAASMLFCGTGAQQLAAVQTSEPHDHATMHHGVASVEQDHAQTAGQTLGSSTDFGHKCSICAACCNGVGLVGIDYVVALAPASQVHLAEPFALVRALPTPVPDKPPRG